MERLIIKSVLVVGLLILSNPSHSVSLTPDLNCLALNVYREARGQEFMIQLSVAHVTLNRWKIDPIKNNVCRVVYAPKQFSWTKHKGWDGKVNYKEWEFSREIAIIAITDPDSDPTNGSLFFHSSTRPRWAQSMIEQLKIGNYTFY